MGRDYADTSMTSYYCPDTGNLIDEETGEVLKRAVSIYAPCIRVAPRWTPAYDVRHVEGYLRMAHGALDGMDINAFSAAVACVIQDMDDEGYCDAGSAGERARDVVEQVAQSFGL